MLVCQCLPFSRYSRSSYSEVLTLDLRGMSERDLSLLPFHQYFRIFALKENSIQHGQKTSTGATRFSKDYRK